MGNRRTLRLAPAQSWQNSASLRTLRLCVTIPIFNAAVGAFLDVRLRPRASGRRQCCYSACRPLDGGRDGDDPPYAGNSKTQCQIRVFSTKARNSAPLFPRPLPQRPTKTQSLHRCQREEVKGGRGERQEDLRLNERLILIKPPLTLGAIKCKPML